jgi:hypothetical protein
MVAVNMRLQNYALHLPAGYSQYLYFTLIWYQLFHHCRPCSPIGMMEQASAGRAQEFALTDSKEVAPCLNNVNSLFYMWRHFL